MRRTARSVGSLLRVGRALEKRTRSCYITIMALTPGKRATTIVLDDDLDRLLDRAARRGGVSRSEFIRRQLRRVLEQFRAHPKPRSAGSVKRLLERGDEDELFRELER